MRERERMPGARGAIVERGGTRFSLWSGSAERCWVCIFDAAGENETARIEMTRGAGDVFAAFVDGAGPGTRYGFRTDGRYDPDRGYWHDPRKLLMDPYALEIDRAYVADPRLAARRGEGGDTAALMPKAIVAAPPDVMVHPPLFRNGGLIYEASVRALTMRHPGIPPERRGTIAALGHPEILGHLKRLGIAAIQLMPVTAWVDERHLAPLGLHNGWGYNPVSFMALDPRLAPGGVAELASAVAALRDAGIGVILDLVFNHTGESDVLGPTLSLRGIDNLAYYRHLPGDPAVLVNDTGCGNTVATQNPEMRRLVVEALRHFVTRCGVDGFRFDLAPVLGRADDGFDPEADLLSDIAADSVLRDRILIAEPWDIGPGGYQLGNFPSVFLEWNDRYRDDVRRFWRGDAGTLGALATRLAGSSDIFGRDGAEATRTVNFVAAHDGMTLADLVAYERKHNAANGEENRDGHDENLSWNCGVEGETNDDAVLAARARDVRAILATLFMSRGTIMLTAGDEFGRTQRGNNNAYAQDNAITWLDWENRDLALEAYVASLGALRRASEALLSPAFLQGAPRSEDGLPDVAWLDASGHPLGDGQWNDPANRRLVMALAAAPRDPFRRVALVVNGDRRETVFALPPADGGEWSLLAGKAHAVPGEPATIRVPGRSAVIMAERMSDPQNSTGKA